MHLRLKKLRKIEDDEKYDSDIDVCLQADWVYSRLIKRGLGKNVCFVINSKKGTSCGFENTVFHMLIEAKIPTNGYCV